MKVKFLSTVFDNPMPQLRSRQSTFPFLAEADNGRILCGHIIGEAFESVDGAFYISESTDGGRTWGDAKKAVLPSDVKCKNTECCKLTRIGANEYAAFGYCYPRPNEELPIGNPATGGLLDDYVFLSRSYDETKTWTKQEKITTHWSNGTEASAPLYVLANGDWVSPITGFPDWNGKMKSRMCGRLLVSHDKGASWNDDTVCMEFENDDTTCYEQRLCQLDTGEIVVIGWNEDVKTGERLNNHYAISYDGGRTFGKTTDTGVKGQATSVTAIGGTKLLALHAVRRDTDRPGIYGFIVDLHDGKWNILERSLIWEPSTPILKDDKMAEIFSFLKFGQPGGILLKNGNVMMSFWYAENGQYKTAVAEIEL